MLGTVAKRINFWVYMFSTISTAGGSYPLVSQWMWPAHNLREYLTLEPCLCVKYSGKQYSVKQYSDNDGNPFHT